MTADPNSTHLAYQCIDQLVEPHIQAIEKQFNSQIVALEHKLRETSPEAHNIYREIDLLIALEKQAIQRACYLAGASTWKSTTLPIP